MGLVEMFQKGVLTVNGKQVLGQVVGTNAEKIHLFGQLVTDEGCGRGFDHDAQFNITVAKILELVENASSRKAKAENFITRFARVYTPIVVALALALALVPPVIQLFVPSFAPGQGFSVWIYRACSFLVVSCPCALVISVPLSFFGGLGAASRRGILIKGSNYLEAMGNLDTEQV